MSNCCNVAINNLFPIYYRAMVMAVTLKALVVSLVAM